MVMTMNDESSKPRHRRRIIGCVLAVPTLLALVVAASFAIDELRFRLNLRNAYGGLTPAEFYSRPGPTEVVFEIERLAAKMGIHSWRSRPRFEPTGERAERYSEFHAAFTPTREEWAAAGEVVLAQPTAEVLTYLEQNRSDLRRIIELLGGPDSPNWGYDEEDPQDGSSTLGLLHLIDLIVLQASESFRAGDQADALLALEAAWNLQQGLLNGPGAIRQTIATAAFRTMQPVLRSMCPPLEHWQQRLEEIEFLPSAYREMHAFGETYREEGRRLARQNDSVVLKAYATFASYDCSHRNYRAIEKLRKQNPKDFAPDSYAQRKKARPWSFLTPCAITGNAIEDYTQWSRAHRTELIAELSALVLEERRRRLDGETSVASFTRPSRVDGLSWIYEPKPEGLEIRLDGDLAYRKGPHELRFLVRPPEADGCTLAE